jgi:hypothetical protein
MCLKQNWSFQNDQGFSTLHTEESARARNFGWEFVAAERRLGYENNQVS